MAKYWGILLLLLVGLLHDSLGSSKISAKRSLVEEAALQELNSRLDHLIEKNEALLQKLRKTGASDYEIYDKSKEQNAEELVNEEAAATSPQPPVAPVGKGWGKRLKNTGRKIGHKFKKFGKNVWKKVKNGGKKLKEYLRRKKNGHHGMGTNQPMHAEKPTAQAMNENQVRVSNWRSWKNKAKKRFQKAGREIKSFFHRRRKNHPGNNHPGNKEKKKPTRD